MTAISLSIGRRLALGFGLLLLMLCAASLTAWLQFGSVRESNRRTVDVDWVKAELAGVVNATTRANARRNMELLITSDAAQVARIDAAIEANKQAISQALERLRTLIHLPEGKARLALVVERRTAYVASFTRVRQLVAAGRRDEAAQLMLAETLPALDALQEPIAALTQLQKDIVVASNEQVGRELAAAQRTMLVLALLGLLFGALGAWWLTRSITQPLAQAAGLARKVAEGDLRSHIQVHGNDELASLLRALRSMNGSLVRIVGDVRGGTEAVSTATSQIAMGNLDLSQRTEEQASSLQQIASSVEQLNATIRQNMDSGRHANQVASRAADVALRGGAVVAEVVQTMDAINDSSRRIADIIGVIDGIAFQTNILALNAAVEAARAGEQGRGFAVVATEVRSLAGRSAIAAREIKQLIATSVGNVSQGCKLVEMAGSTMDEIVVSVRRVADIMGELTAASAEQSAGVEQINLAMGQMDQMTQSNAALVEQAAAAAQSLEHQSRALVATVDVFKLDSGQVLLPA
ncbi:MAG: MCP four helix bundle domain-containing protein [Burkholderiales bacterium]|nr:MCP four helix bundle domain-containing protein [Burkholderiales bacterium]